MLDLRACLALDLRDDPLGQRLAQLHTPLIEGIDLPNRALGEDAVLVQRYQLAQRLRRQPLQQERVGRTVTLEGAVRHQPVGRAFRLDLPGGLAEGQRLRLGEDIGKQHALRHPASDRRTRARDCPSMASHQIDQGENADPDDIQRVPKQAPAQQAPQHSRSQVVSDHLGPQIDERDQTTGDMPTRTWRLMMRPSSGATRVVLSR